VQSPVNGTVSLVAGNITFTADGQLQWPGQLHLYHHRCRRRHLDATVNITVTAVDDLPVAVNDTATTAEDTALVISAASLLGNDTGLGDSPVTVTSVQSPVNGTVSLVAGNITFTPTANYNGPASFTYTITDADGDTSTATGQITSDTASMTCRLR